MMTKMKEKLSKLPYSIFIGVSVIVVFYATLALILTGVIFDGIASATGDSASIFDTWWQTLIFVVDLLAGIVLVGAIVAKILLAERKKTGWFEKVFNKAVWAFACGFFAILFAFLAVGGDLAVNKYSGPINSAFGININQRVTDPALIDGETDKEYFKSDFVKKDAEGNQIFKKDEAGISRPVYDDEAMLAHAAEITEQIASEGSVVLWNNEKDGVPALPLAEGSKVSLLGRAACEWSHVGQGSGQKGFNPAKSLRQAFSACGLELNPKLDAEYRKIKADNPKSYTWDSNSNPPAFDTVTELAADNIRSHGDAAVMVISRNSGEGWDPYWWFDLSAEEKNYLSKLQEYKRDGVVKKIVLLINSSNAVSFKSIVDYDIDACVWVGMGGDKSYEQTANVLSGKVMPSGRLVDTFVRDIEKSEPAYPRDADRVGDVGGGYTYANYDESAVGLPAKSTAGTWNNKYLIYQEGIYVGYRYYETRYADSVTNEGANADSNVGSSLGHAWDYTEEVAFPFGHGVSYTTFEYANYAVSEGDDAYTVSVDVNNTGDRDGKEVVQIYLQKPYTSYDKTNSIEKAAVELVGFDKVTVPAGGSVTASVTVPKSAFKTYDAYGKGTYILEAGNYYLAAGKDAHDALNNILAARGFTTENGMDANGDARFAFKKEVAEDDFTTYSVNAAGKKIENRFDDVDLNRYEGTADQHTVYMTRSDWSTFPTGKTRLEIKGGRMIADMQYGTKVTAVEGDILPTYGTVTAENRLQLYDMIGAKYDDPRWENLLDQLTWDDQMRLLTYGFRMIAGAPNAGIPGGFAYDGPAGVGKTCYPCEVLMASTFDVELMEELGKIFGTEAMHFDVMGVYAPGANIHRSASGGRNWEYYSEDPYLSGKILAAEVRGLQSAGVIVFTKHFVLNDQEINRAGVCVWANEQTVREIYLKPFEIGVAEADMNGIMTSFNRLGCTWSGRHKGLLTDVLRNEWGFTGVTQTDCVSDGYEHMINEDAIANGLLAGQNIWMSYGYLKVLDNYKDNPTVAKALREGVRQLIYRQANSFAMNGVGEGVYFVEITPWWETAIFSIMWVAFALMIVTALGTAFAFVFPWAVAFKKRKDEEAKARANGELPEKDRKKQQEPSVPVSSELAAVQGQLGDAQKNLFAILTQIKKAEKNVERLQEEGVAYKNTKEGKKYRRNVIVIAAAIGMAACLLVGLLVGLLPRGGGGTALSPDKPSDSGAPAAHICSSVCPVCGLCTDMSCKEDACRVKCGGTFDGVTVLQAEDADGAEDNDFGTDFAKDWVNVSRSMTLKFDSSVATTATLMLALEGGEEESKFSDSYYVEINGEVFAAKANVPAKEDGFVEINLGCIPVRSGENSVYFLHYDNTPVYGIDSAKVLYGSSSVSEVQHVCQHVCPECGGCRDADCTQAACADKCGTYATFATYTAKDHATCGGGCSVNSDGVVGGLSNNAGQTVSFTVPSDMDRAAGLTVALTKNNYYASVMPFNKFMTVTVNGESFTTRAVISLNDETSWTESFEIPLGCIRLRKGNNTIVFTTTGSEGRNFHYIKIGVGKKTSDIRCEAIDAVCTAGESNKMPNVENTHTETVLETLNRNKGATFSFSFRTNEAAKKLFYIALTKRGDAFVPLSDFLSITLNGEKYDTDALMWKNDGNDWWTTKEICAGVANLRKGVNTVTFTVVSEEDIGRNFGYIRFGSDAMPDRYRAVDTNCTRYTEGKYSTGETGLPNNHENPNILGGINKNKGATVTFYMTSPEDCEKFFYAAITQRNETRNFSDFMSITVNGEAYATVAQMRNNGSSWFTSEELFLGSVHLKAGVNTVTFTVVSDADVGRNFEYIRFE